MNSMPDASFDYRIGDLLVDVGRQSVVRDGIELHLPRLSFDTLCTLIAAAPSLIPNAELMRQVWRGTVVSLETVTQRVKLLRDALGDNPRKPRYIIGLRGRGYRLLPLVEHQAANAPLQRTYGDADHGTEMNAHATRWVPPRSTTAVAVLPFRDLSEFGNDKHLADGLTEELICRLSRLPGLRVPALNGSVHSSLQRATIPEIARALNVALIFDGSIRRAGDQLRISVLLVRASGHYLWSRSYDRQPGDALSLEDELAAHIVCALQATLATGLELSWPRYPKDDAYDLWLRSMQGWRRGSRNSFEDAQWLLERAVSIAPSFAAAWADLANIYVHRAVGDYATVNREAFAHRARCAALRAVALAPDCAKSHLVLYDVRQRVDHDCRKAEAAARRAFELEPTSPAVLEAVARIDSWHGANAAAIGRAEEAAALEPLDPWNWFNLGLMCSLGGRYDEALTAMRRFAAAAPQALIGASTLACAELDAGRPTAALATLESVGGEEFPNQFRPAILDALGRNDEADALLQRYSAGRHNKIIVATTYARRGDLNRAIHGLSRLVATDENPLEIRILAADPSLTELRKHRLWPAFWSRVQRALNIPGQ
jgi:TolB-like protein/tetratricopeptide (TPR) repeat protein